MDSNVLEQLDHLCNTAQRIQDVLTGNLSGDEFEIVTRNLQEYYNLEEAQEILSDMLYDMSDVLGKLRTRRIVKCMHEGMLVRSFESNLYKLGSGRWGSGSLLRELKEDYDDVFVELPDVNSRFEIAFDDEGTQGLNDSYYVFLNGEKMGRIIQVDDHWYPTSMKFDCNFRHVEHQWGSGSFGFYSKNKVGCYSG